MEDSVFPWGRICAFRKYRMLLCFGKAIRQHDEALREDVRENSDLNLEKSGVGNNDHKTLYLRYAT